MRSLRREARARRLADDFCTAVRLLLPAKTFIRWNERRNLMLVRKPLTLMLILVLSGLLASSCSLGKKESKMTMGELPAPVRSAVQKVTAGSTVTEIEKVESGGK